MTLEKSDPIHFNSSKVQGVITAKIPEATVLTDVGAELTVQLPFASSHNFQSMFEYFDGNLDNLGIRSYGVSVTTLEEVFIKVQHGTHTQAIADQGRQQIHDISSGDVVMETSPKAKVVEAAGKFSDL